MPCSQLPYCNLQPRHDSNNEGYSVVMKVEDAQCIRCYNLCFEGFLRWLNKYFLTSEFQKLVAKYQNILDLCHPLFVSQARELSPKQFGISTLPLGWHFRGRDVESLIFIIISENCQFVFLAYQLPKVCLRALGILLALHLSNPSAHVAYFVSIFSSFALPWSH